MKNPLVILKRHFETFLYVPGRRRALTAEQRAKRFVRGRWAAVLLAVAAFFAAHPVKAVSNLPIPDANTTLPDDAIQGTVMSLSHDTRTWTDFSIGDGYKVEFTGSGTAINRVTGTAKSDIFGALTGDKVYILNPNGILFGGTADVNVRGLVAAAAKSVDGTHDTELTFKGVNGNVTVDSGAKITAGEFAYLVGKSISNSGMISAGDIRLVATSDKLFEGDENVSDKSVTIGTAENGATISFEWGEDGEAAAIGEGAGEIKGGYVNNDGTIEATKSVAAQAVGNINITGGSVAAKTVDGGTTTFGDISMTALGAGKSVKIGSVDGTAEVEGANITLTGSKSAQLLGGTITGHGDVSLSGREYVAVNGDVTGGNIALTTTEATKLSSAVGGYDAGDPAGVLQMSGTITADGGNVTIDSVGSASLAGAITAAGDGAQISVKAADAKGGIQNDAVLTAGTIILDGAKVQGGEHGSINSANLALVGDSFGTSEQALTITASTIAANVVNDIYVSKTGDLTVGTVGDVTGVTAGGNAAIAATGALAVDKKIEAANVTLGGSSITAKADITAKDSGTLTLNDDFTQTAGTIEAGSVVADGKKITQQGVNGTEDVDPTLISAATITAAQINQSGGRIVATDKIAANVTQEGCEIVTAKIEGDLTQNDASDIATVGEITGAVTQNAGLIQASDGTTTYNSGNLEIGGLLTQTGGEIKNVGTLTLGADGNALAGTVNADAIAGGKTIEVQNGGDVNATAITASTLTVKDGAAVDTKDGTGTLAITGNMVQDGGAVATTAGENVTVSGTTQQTGGTLGNVTGTVGLTGALTQTAGTIDASMLTLSGGAEQTSETGAVNAGTLVLASRDKNVTLDKGANKIGAVYGNVNNLALKDADGGLVIGDAMHNLDAKGNVTIETVDNLTEFGGDYGKIVARSGKTKVTSTQGDINLDHGWNMFSEIEASAANGSVTIVNATGYDQNNPAAVQNLTVDGITAKNDIRIVAKDAVTVAGTVATTARPVDGENKPLDTAGNIRLESTAGALNVNAAVNGNNVTLKGATTVSETVAGNAAADKYVVAGSGDITVSTPGTVGANAAYIADNGAVNGGQIAASGFVYVSGKNTGSATAKSTDGGNWVVKDDNGRSDGQGGGYEVDSDGTIVFKNVDTVAISRADKNVRVLNTTEGQGVNVGTVASGSSAAWTITEVKEANATQKTAEVTLAGTGGNTAGATGLEVNNLSIDVKGDVTQDANANVVAHGTTGIETSGAITLANAANDFTGTVTAQGASVTLKDANGIALGNVTATGADGNVDVEALNGTLSVNSGATVKSEKGGVTLKASQAANSTATADVNVNGTVSAAKTATLDAAGKVRVKGNVTGADVDIDAGDFVNVAAGKTVTAKAGNVTIDAGGNIDIYGTVQATSTEDGQGKVTAMVASGNASAAKSVLVRSGANVAGVNGVELTGRKSVQIAGTVESSAKDVTVLADEFVSVDGGSVTAAKGKATLETTVAQLLTAGGAAAQYQAGQLAGVMVGGANAVAAKDVSIESKGTVLVSAGSSITATAVDSNGGTVAIESKGTTEATVETQGVKRQGVYVLGTVTASGADTETTKALTIKAAKDIVVDGTVQATAMSGTEGSGSVVASATSGDIQVPGTVSATKTAALTATAGTITDDATEIGHALKSDGSSNVEANPFATAANGTGPAPHTAHVIGATVELSASGDIGGGRTDTTGGTPLDIEAGTVMATSTAGSVYLFETDDIAVGKISAAQNAKLETVDGAVTIAAGADAGISATAGDVLVAANGDGKGITQKAAITATAKVVSVIAKGAIAQNANITAGGTVDVESTGAGITVAEGSTTEAGGNVRYKAATTLNNYGTIKTTGTDGQVSLGGTTVGGAGQIQASSFALIADSVGTASQAFKTKVSNLAVKATKGDIFIENEGDVTITALAAANGAAVNRVSLDSASSSIGGNGTTGQSVSGLVSDKGSVKLETKDAGTITVDANVEANGATGNATLVANGEGKKVVVNSGKTVKANDNATLTATGKNGSVEVSGTLKAENIAKAEATDSGKTGDVFVKSGSQVLGKNGVVLSATKNVTIDAAFVKAGAFQVNTTTGAITPENPEPAANGSPANLAIDAGNAVEVKGGAQVAALGTADIDAKAGGVTVTGKAADNTPTRLVSHGNMTIDADGGAVEIKDGAYVGSHGTIDVGKDDGKATKSLTVGKAVADGVDTAKLVAVKDISVQASESILVQNTAKVGSDRNVTLSATGDNATAKVDAGALVIAETAATVKAEKGSAEVSGTVQGKTNAEVTAKTLAEVKEPGLVKATADKGAASVSATDGDATVSGTVQATGKGATASVSAGETSTVAKTGAVKADGEKLVDDTVDPAVTTSSKATVSGKAVTVAAEGEAKGLVSAEKGEASVTASAGKADIAGVVTAADKAEVKATGGDAEVSGTVTSTADKGLAKVESTDKNATISGTVEATGKGGEASVTAAKGTAMVTKSGIVKADGEKADGDKVAKATVSGKTATVAAEDNAKGTVSAAKGESSVTATDGKADIAGTVTAADKAAVSATGGDAKVSGTVTATAAKGVAKVESTDKAVEISGTVEATGSGGDAIVEAGNGVMITGTVDAADNVRVAAESGGVKVDGTVTAGQNATLIADAGNVTIEAGKTVTATAGDVLAQAKTGNVTVNGKVSSSAGTTVLKADAGDVKIASGASVTTKDLGLGAGQKIDIVEAANAAIAVTGKAALKAADDITIKDLKGDINLAAKSDQGNVTITIPGKVNVLGDTSVSATSVTDSGADGDEVSVAANGLDAAKELSVTAGGLSGAGASVKSSGDASLTVTEGGDYTVANTSAGGNLTLDVGGSTQVNSLEAGRDLTLDTGKALSASSVKAGGTANLKVGGNASVDTLTAGTLEADVGGSFESSKLVEVKNDATLGVKGDVTAKEIATGGALTIAGQGGSGASGNLEFETMTARSVEATTGSVAMGKVSATDATFDAKGSITDNGSEVATKTLTMKASGDIGTHSAPIVTKTQQGGTLKDVSGRNVYLEETASGTVGVGTIKASNRLEFSAPNLGQNGRLAPAGAGLIEAGAGGATLDVAGHVGSVGDSSSHIKLKIDGPLDLKSGTLDGKTVWKDDKGYVYVIAESDPESSPFDVMKNWKGYNWGASPSGAGDRNQKVPGLVILDGQVLDGNPDLIRKIHRAEAFTVETPELKSKQGVFGSPVFVHTDMDVNEAASIGSVDYLRLDTLRFQPVVDDEVNATLLDDWEYGNGDYVLSSFESGLSDVTKFDEIYTRTAKPETEEQKAQKAKEKAEREAAKAEAAKTKAEKAEAKKQARLAEKAAKAKQREEAAKAKAEAKAAREAEAKAKAEAKAEAAAKAKAEAKAAREAEAKAKAETKAGK